MRMGGVGHPLLGREGVRGKPVEQLRAPGTEHVDLRAVDVGVDEARQHEAAAVVDTLPAGAGVGHLGTDDAAVLDQQPVIGAPAHAVGVARLEPGVGGVVEQIPAQGEAGRLAPHRGRHAEFPHVGSAGQGRCRHRGHHGAGTIAWAASCQASTRRPSRR